VPVGKIGEECEFLVLVLGDHKGFDWHVGKVSQANFMEVGMLKL
jgi:hypothetical protein